jgi:hypothetical protein
MFLFAGSAMGALGYLSALSQTALASTAAVSGNPQNSAPDNNFVGAGANDPLTSGSGPSTAAPSPTGQSPGQGMTPGVMSTLFSAQSQATTSGTGGADGSVLDGSVSGTQDDRGSNLGHGSGVADLGATSGDGANGGPGQGDRTQTITNSNGSTTTIITHADGTESMTTTSAASSSTPDGGAKTLLTQLFQRQTQALAPAGGQSLSVSA